jgi:hypothetical protein
MRFVDKFVQKKTIWTEMDFDELWKSLFLCMWMSDKAKFWQQLASQCWFVAAYYDKPDGSYGIRG